MTRHHSLRLAIVGGLAMAMVSITTIAAQDATPVPLGADHCTVDPIDPDTYNAAILEGIPPLHLSVAPEGTPADAETIAAVTDTIEQSIACTNIGDLGRLLAVIDPAYAPTLLGVPYGQVPAAIEAAAQTSYADEATPLVDDIDQQGLVSSLLGVTDILDLADGSVAAVATISRQGYPTSEVTIYLQYHEEAGRYIIINYSFHDDSAEDPF
ncbi:MAG: hypothetical protein ACTHQE_12515 [Thermomicrobiales bacterium]